MLLEGEKFEPLGSGIEVIVSKRHIFWTDTILLANFAKPKKSDRACDLGCGCGTIPLIWCRESATTPENILGVEIQKEAYDMACRSVEHNKLKDKINIINADLRNLNGITPFGIYNLVVCNPPYKAEGTGIVNPDSSLKAARHESECTIDDITACASKLLQFGGRFCICQRPERLPDITEAMRKYNIEPKRLRFVQLNTKKTPKLLLIEGRRGGNKGGLKLEPTLLLEDDFGNCSQEMLEIYGSFAYGHQK